MKESSSLRRRGSALLTALCVVILTLSSCMPIARYTPAQGGPNPPLGENNPVSQPQPDTAEANLADVETDAAASAPEIEIAPEIAANADGDDAAASEPEIEVVAHEAISMQAAIACLEAGDVVYGLALQNTNVRQDADVEACRIGRIPKGALVRITGSFDPANPGANVALASVFASAANGEDAATLDADAPATSSTPATPDATNSAATPDPTETVSVAFSALFPNLASENANQAASSAATPQATATAQATASPQATATPAPQMVAAPDDTPDDALAIGYVEDIQPIFQRTCSSCHSGIVKSNDLQVTIYEGLMAGGKSGPPVIPGDAEASLLWTQIESGYMPLIGELNDTQKALVRDWIDAGAPETRPTAPAQIAVAPVEEAAAPRPVPADDAAADASQAEPVLAFDPVATNGDTVASTDNAQTAPSNKAWGSWLLVNSADYNAVADSCAAPDSDPLALVSSELILPVACGAEPNARALDLLRVSLALPVSDTTLLAASSALRADTAPAALAASAPDTTESAAQSAAESATETTEAVAPPAAIAPAAGAYSAASAGISAPALGVSAPTDNDGWLIPRGGLCVERKLADNNRSITALAFSPDGRLYIAFDSLLTGEVDPMVLYDAFHPSRSVAIWDPNSGTSPSVIWDESTRITGLDHDGSRLWLSRAGEVGVLSDAGEYTALAGGFAVDSHLFHANNGIVVTGGWVYVSAGGVRDGYSEGPIVGISEGGAQAIVSGGNPYAARIVRAPVDALLSTRSIATFTTAARGVRNPYGIASDPSGRLWFTDNGATNVPDEIDAGDEVSMLNPAAIGGGDEGAPYYGFPLAILEPQPWFVPPVASLVNSAAPTGITWALGTVYFAQYGRDPGLYRLGNSGGSVVAERVLMGWPILAVTTAPDGALWIGMGDGGLYRITSGCAN